MRKLSALSVQPGAWVRPGARATGAEAAQSWGTERQSAGHDEEAEEKGRRDGSGHQLSRPAWRNKGVKRGCLLPLPKVHFQRL